MFSALWPSGGAVINLLLQAQGFLAMIYTSYTYNSHTHTLRFDAWSLIKTYDRNVFLKVRNKVKEALPQQGQWSWEGSWAVCWLWWWINPQCRQCFSDSPGLLGSAASSHAPHHVHALDPELPPMDIRKGNTQ